MLRLIKRSEEVGANPLEGCGLSPHLCRLLCMRGVRTPQEAAAFLAPSFSDLGDPLALCGMEQAVQVIREAMAAKAPIAVYGDYDVDGICATALLVEALRSHGAQAESCIPLRHKDGYGLNCGAIEALAQRVKLVVTVDCGITNVREAELARQLGLRLVVTDHHEPPQRLPQADALVDPLLGGAPSQPLCGAGVAFKLVCALFGAEAARPYLELAALATVADLVPLMGENRVITALGLAQLQQTRRPGLRALIRVSGLEGKTITAGHVGFQLGPRLNAGGRLGDAARCVELLLTRREDEAARIAGELDALNAERQRMETAIVREAEKQVLAKTDFLNDRVLIAVGKGWNKGVVGLAAGRLTEKYAWPSVVLSEENGMLTGSARSVPGVNIFHALERCASLFERFGGHAMAAGMTLHSENFAAFEKSLQEAAAAVAREDAYVPSVQYDFEIPLAEVTVALADDLAKLAPNGIGNPAPVLAARGAHVLEARVVGAEGQHLKLRLEQDGASLGGIAFGLGGEKAGLAETVDVVFSPGVNEWMGRRSAECDVKRIVPHGGAEAFARACKEREEAFSLYIIGASVQAQPQAPEDVLCAQVRWALEKSYQGTLLTVKTLQGALRWATFLQQEGLEERLDFCFGRPKDARCYNCLCAMPDPECGAGYAQRIALDDADVAAALRERMPSDGALRALYRTLRAWPGAVPSERALCEAVRMPPMAVRVGLCAFAELKLALFRPEPFEVALLPAKKCSLSDSPTLTRLRRICHWEEER